MTEFASLGLLPELLRAVSDAGYSSPTPIQAASIPALLEGRDLLGCAQTGTGKTAAFALPVLQRMSATAQPGRRRPVRALVLSPTRELAAQIAESFETYGKHLRLTSTVVFGGVNIKRQMSALDAGVDILVATPGRLLDLMGQGYANLSNVEHFVLDEADRMLDMGFLPDIRRVMRALPAQRQNLLFSATMPEPIAQLASSFLRDPLRVSVTPPSSTVDRIEQRVHFVEKGDKPKLLHFLLEKLDVEQAIVFTRTKHGANRLVTWLEREGVRSAALHGNKSQNARERAIEGFRDGSLRLLIATDIASRGIDIDGVSHVFNYDLPNESESYVHRIGRTGRAGRDGYAVAFCSDEELDYLRDIERLTRQRIPVDREHAWHSAALESGYAAGQRGSHVRPARGGGGGGGRGGRPGGGGGGGRSGGGGGGGGRPGTGGGATSGDGSSRNRARGGRGGGGSGSRPRGGSGRS